MNIDFQLNTYEQGKQLKFLGIGINSGSYFRWVSFRNESSPKDQCSLVHRIILTEYEVEDYYDRSYLKDVEDFPAFSVSELGILLPDVDYNEFVLASFPDAVINEEGIDIDPSSFSIFRGPSVCHLEAEPFDNKVYPTEAQARAAFLIYCIENKKITVDEINYRLSTNN